MRPALLQSLVVATVFSSAQAFAYGGGVVGYSGATAGMTCAQCHGVTTGTAPTVTIAGPATLLPGATGDYTLTITGGPGVRGGMNVAKDVAAGTLQADGT